MQSKKCRYFFLFATHNADYPIETNKQIRCHRQTKAYRQKWHSNSFCVGERFPTSHVSCLASLAWRERFEKQITTTATGLRLKAVKCTFIACLIKFFPLGGVSFISAAVSLVERSGLNLARPFSCYFIQ